MKQWFLVNVFQKETCLGWSQCQVQSEARIWPCGRGAPQSSVFLGLSSPPFSTLVCSGSPGMNVAVLGWLLLGTQYGWHGNEVASAAAVGCKPWSGGGTCLQVGICPPGPGPGAGLCSQLPAQEAGTKSAAPPQAGASRVTPSHPQLSSLRGQAGCMGVAL